MRSAPASDSTVSFWRREVSEPEWLVIATLSVVASIVLWWSVTRTGGPISPLSLPPPLEVADSFLRLMKRPYLGSTLAQHIAASYRPRRSILVVSRLLAQHFADTPLAEYFASDSD